MKKRIFSVMFFAVVALLMVLPASGAQTSTEEQTAMEIAALINQYRVKNGLYDYLYNTTLADVAQKHTDYQVSIGESTHYGEGHTTSKDRVEASGYGAGEYIFTSEMIYSGSFATPEAAFEWWQNSPIHNGIMLSEEFDEFGVGVRITDDKKYYTVDVARIKGVTSPGVGSPPVEPVADVVIPVTAAVPNQDGSIVHVVEAGQTLQQIATAYAVSLDTLLSNNGLTADAALSPGQNVVVKMAVSEVAAPTQESQTAKVAPIASAPEAVPVVVAAEGSQPTVPEGYMLLSNVLVTVLVVVALISSAGVTFLTYLRLSESGKRKRF